MHKACCKFKQATEKKSKLYKLCGRTHVCLVLILNIVRMLICTAVPSIVKKIFINCIYVKKLAFELSPEKNILKCKNQCSKVFLNQCTVL